MRTVAGRWLGGAGLSAVLLVISGCARYEYVLVQPAQFTRSVTEKPTRITYAPMEYEFTAEDESLMMAVINPGQEPVRVVASKSFLVSPDGESHPLPASTIAPRSYRALLLPPEPAAYRASPSFSIGFGVGHFWGGPHFGTGFGYHDYWYGGPREYYQVNPPDYWPWETGPVRMRLSFEHGSTNTFEHDFVIERRKVE
jgi:hypothetical protein